VNPSQIFCSGNQTSSATGTPSGSGTASRTSGGSGPDATGSGSSDSTGAAAPMGVSKAGLGMLGMFVVSAFAGALL
jgi:unsaturated rhamnogalacturonyl hydrolase